MYLSNFICYYTSLTLLIITVNSFNDNNLILIISFDGFRYDYVNRNVTPTLSNLRKNSSHAPYMIPVFPSLTCTNHASISSGLYPEVHGVLDNMVYDKKLKKELTYGYELYHYDERIVPLWILNEDTGGNRRSGCMHWPGCEFRYQGKYPTYLSYNMDSPWESQVDTLLSWFQDPVAPVNLALVHVEEPDITCHKFGPDSVEVNRAIAGIDQSLQYFLKRAGDIGLLDKLNIIFLSDHGSVHVHQPNYLIDLDLYVDRTTYARAGEPINVQIHPVEGKEAEVLEALRRAKRVKGEKFTPFAQCEIPERYHYKRCDRTPPILLRADLGYLIRSQPSSMPGHHGYDPAIPAMRSFFMAVGPNFEENLITEPFECIHIFPLVVRILQLNDPPIRPNGTLCTLQKILKNCS